MPRSFFCKVSCSIFVVDSEEVIAKDDDGPRVFTTWTLSLRTRTRLLPSRHGGRAWVLLMYSRRNPEPLCLESTIIFLDMLLHELPVDILIVFLCRYDLKDVLRLEQVYLSLLSSNLCYALANSLVDLSYDQGHRVDSAGLAGPASPPRPGACTQPAHPC